MTLNNLKSLSDLANTAKSKPGKEILKVPVSDVISKAQVRKRFRKIEELATTIQSEGQQSPIIVSPKNEDGKYVIQKGERRWRACVLIKLKTIDVVINEKTQSKLDETAGELIENIQRDDLTPVEIAEALNQFIMEGWKQNKIAERLGKNSSYVSAHLSLLKMPECVRDLYEHNVTSDTETLNNLRLLFETNESRCQAVCGIAMTEGITRKQSRDFLNNEKRIQESKIEDLHQKTQHKKEEENLNLDLDSDDDESSERIDINSIDDSNEHLRNENEVSGEDILIIEDLGDIAHKEDKTIPKDNSKEWKTVPAEQLVFTVLVSDKDQIKKGVIMNDRVSLTPNTVWVKIIEGREECISVSVSDIKLISVES